MSGDQGRLSGLFLLLWVICSFLGSEEGVKAGERKLRIFSALLYFLEESIAVLGAYFISRKVFSYLFLLKMLRSKVGDGIKVSSRMGKFLLDLRLVFEFFREWIISIDFSLSFLPIGVLFFTLHSENRKSLSVFGLSFWFPSRLYTFLKEEALYLDACPCTILFWLFFCIKTDISGYLNLSLFSKNMGC